MPPTHGLLLRHSEFFDDHRRRFHSVAPSRVRNVTAIARLVTATNTPTWAVVGRQMVAIHATVAGVEVPRATDDGDIVVDVRTFTRDALRHHADALAADGFDSEQSPEGIVRLMKGDPKIDLLAPDGLGPDPVETGKGGVVEAPGGTQAVERAEPIIVELAGERARFAPRTCLERSSRSQLPRRKSSLPHVSTVRSTNGISPPS